MKKWRNGEVANQKQVGLTNHHQGYDILEHANIILSHVTCRIMVYEDIVCRQDIMLYKDGFVFILIIFIIKIALFHLTTVI